MKIPAYALLAAGFAAHYGYGLFPQDMAALIWNASGAAFRLMLLCVVLWHRKGPILLVGAWLACEELLVIGCNAAFIVKPWTVPEGADMCSSLLGYDLGKLGALIVAALVLLVMRRPDRVDR